MITLQNDRKLIDGIEMTLEDVVVEYETLVWYFVHQLKFKSGTVIEPDDLFSDGVIGLIKAFNKFDPAKDVRFRTLSSRYIQGSIYNAFRDRYATMKFSREAWDIRLKVKRLLDEGSHTLEDIASILNTNIDTVTEAYASIPTAKYTSEATENTEGKATTIEEYLNGSPIDWSQIYVNEFINRLEPREQLVTRMLLQERLQTEIAEAIDKTPLTVNRELKKIAKKYRQFIEENGND